MYTLILLTEDMSSYARKYSLILLFAGTTFHQFVVPPLDELRKDCRYSPSHIYPTLLLITTHFLTAYTNMPVQRERERERAHTHAHTHT